MFANCQMGGMNMGMPDVCMTPVGPSVVPIPYPNIAQGATADPSTAAKKVLISGAPAHTLQTLVPTSSGDEGGVIGGIMSGLIMGPCRHLMGAPNVLIGGSPATKLNDPVGQNGTSFNVRGLTVAPAQTKVMIMSGGGGGDPATNSSKKSEEQDEPTIKNPRWEHVDENMKKESPDIAIADDIVSLMVDVSNIEDGTTVTFKIFEAVTAKRIGMVHCEVIDGVGSAKWRVRTLYSREEKKHSLEFEVRVRGLTSKRAKIKLGVPFIFSV